MFTPVSAVDRKLTSNVVVLPSSAKQLKLTRPAISPDGSNVSPCGNELALPDFNLYSKANFHCFHQCQ